MKKTSKARRDEALLARFEGILKEIDSLAKASDRVAMRRVARQHLVLLEACVEAKEADR